MLGFLPAFDVQRRVVSYLIRRALGRFVVLDRDLDSLTADLGNGHLSLANLTINCHEISALLPGSVPLRCLDATVEHVSLTISTPLSWSSTVHVDLANLEVRVQVIPRDPRGADEPTLAESVIDAFLDDEAPPADLQRSLLDLSADDGGIPGSFDPARSASASAEDIVHERGLLSDVLRGLLRRLRLEVTGITVQVASEADLDIALHTERASYSTREDEARAVEIRGLGVTVRPPTSPRPTDSAESADDMKLSMAVADLRDSEPSLASDERRSSSPDSDTSSVYASMHPSIARPALPRWRPLLWFPDGGLRVTIGPTLSIESDNLVVAVCTEDLDAIAGLLQTGHAPRPSDTSKRKSPSPSPPPSLSCSSLRLILFYEPMTPPDALMTFHEVRHDNESTIRASRLTLSCLDLLVHHEGAQIRSLTVEDVYLRHGLMQRLCLLRSGDAEAADVRASFAVRAEGPLDAIRTLVCGVTRIDADLDFLQRFEPTIEVARALLARVRPVARPTAERRMAPPPAMPDMHCADLVVTVKMPSQDSTHSAQTKMQIRMLQVQVRRQARHRSTHLEMLVKTVSLCMLMLDPEPLSSTFLEIPHAERHGALKLIVPDADNKSLSLETGNVAISLGKQQWDGIQLFLDGLSRFLAARATPTPSPMQPVPQRPFRAKAASIKVPLATVNMISERRTFTWQVETLEAFLELTNEMTLGANVRLGKVSLAHAQDACKPFYVLSTDQITTVPCVQVRIRPLEGGKKNGNRIGGTLTGLCIRYSPLTSWTKDLASFVKAPAGVFENVVPAERTDIEFVIHNVSLLLLPENQSSAGICLLEETSLATSIRHKEKSSRTNIILDRIHFLLAGEKADRTGLLHVAGSRDKWMEHGYADIGRLLQCRISIHQGLKKDPATKVFASDAQLSLALCADSLGTITALSGGLAPVTSITDTTARSHANLPGASNQTALAVQEAPSLTTSTADLLANDVHVESLSFEQPKQPDAWHLGASPATPPLVDGCICRCLHEGGLRIIDDFMTVARKHASKPADRATATVELLLTRCNLVLGLHKGFDWEETRITTRKQLRSARRQLMRIQQALAEGQTPDESPDDIAADLRKSVWMPLKAGSDSNIADELLQALDGHGGSEPTSVDEGDWQNLSAPNRDPSRPLPRPPNSDAGRFLHRSVQPAVTFQLGGLKVEWWQYVPGERDISRLLFAADTLQVIDCLSTSTWHKFMTEMRVGDGGIARPNDAAMLRLEVIARPSGRRSDSTLPASELAIKVKCVPLRLFVDQDVLDFLKTFSRSESAVEEKVVPAGYPDSTFIQRLEILPVKIKMDYKPKRVDYEALRRGRTLELMNFFSFEGSEVTLRHVVLHSVQGWSTLSELLQDIWTPDVRSNQLADFLSGISPIRSIVTVGGSLADLVLLPIDQFRRDGRFGRGLQRGATSFTKTTIREILRLGARLSTGTQVVLEQAEALLGASPGLGAQLPGTLSNEAETYSRYAQQPTTAREGLTTAVDSFRGNLRAAAQTVFAVPLEVFERSPADGPVRAVVRATPIGVVFRPIIGTTEAVSKALLGLGNAIDPAGAQQAADKYKPPPMSRTSSQST